MEIIPISFNETQVQQLRFESKRLGESIACIVRSAVNNYFSKLEGCK